MTIQECIDKTIQLIREYSNNGIKITEQKNADYILSIPSLINAACKEIAQIKKIKATLKLTQNPISNMLGNTLDKTYQHLDKDVSYQALGAKSYYFEVDNIATVFVEEEINGVWTVLKQIDNTVKKQFTAYKGVISPSPLNNVRIRYSGLYPYQYRYTALFAYAYPTDNDVIDYTPWVRYNLPSDFYMLDSVSLENDIRQYTPKSDYFVEGKQLVLNYFYNGQFIIKYFRYPVTIKDTDSRDTLIDLDEECCELIPYYCGGHIKLDEDVTISTVLANEYQLKLSRLIDNTSFGLSTIVNSMGW